MFVRTNQNRKIIQGLAAALISTLWVGSACAQSANTITPQQRPVQLGRPQPLANHKPLLFENRTSPETPAYQAQPHVGRQATNPAPRIQVLSPTAVAPASTVAPGQPYPVGNIGNRALSDQRRVPARLISGQQNIAEMAIPGLTPVAPKNQSETVGQNLGAASLADDDLLLSSESDLLSAPGAGASPQAPSAAESLPAPPSNRALPKSVDNAINQRYQQAIDALPAPRGSASASNSARTSVEQDSQGSPDDAAAALAVPESLPRPPATSGEAAANSAIPGSLIPKPDPLAGLLPGVGSLKGDAATATPTNKSDSTNQKKKPLKAPKYDGLPTFIDSYGLMKGPHTDTLAKQVPYDAHAFLPSPLSQIPTDPYQESQIYNGKFPVRVQRPLVELWRRLFYPGTYPPSKNWFGRYNPVMPHFMVYGDFRTGLGVNENAAGTANSWAFRTNLDMDLEITATERIHGFITPLDRGGDYTRLDFSNDAEFVNRTDLRMDTLFFEGDAGAIWGGISDQDGPFDLPFSFGLIPFFYQNGIWANDAAMGAAFALPAKHNRWLNWSNYDATFFWASDQINSDAFPGDNNAAEFFGTAWFIEAYDGYFEVDYAFVHDDVGQHRSYHNFSVAFSKRYFHNISNSIRLITNFDQALPRDQRTAQGHLLLIENALMTSNPNTFVPYLNFFYGQGRTQSLARAGGAGGILNNTGINFETDGLTGYPTLDATGVNTAGGAIGLNILGRQFSQQLIVEFAALAANGSAQFRNAPGDQYAVGIRYQKPLTNAWIFRTDHMFGFLRNADDIRGNRIELRWKF